MAMLEIQCPHCRAKFHLPSDQAAKTVRCGACQQVFTTPTSAPVAAPLQKAKALPPAPIAPRVRVKEAEALPAREKRPSRMGDDDDDYDDSPRSKSKKLKQSQTAKFPLIPVLAGVGGLVALLVVVVGVVLVTRSSSTPEVAKTSTVPVAASTPNTTPPPSTESVKPKAPPPTTTAPTTPSPKADVTAGEAIQAVKNSTVYIRCHYPNALGMGSGFFAGESGYVVTNSHVIGYGDRLRRPSSIEVVVNSGEKHEKKYRARIVGIHVDDDLALLWINKDEHKATLPAPLTFARSADLVETQEVLIFGFPLGEQLGLNISVNKSSVSSLRKENGVVAVVQVAGGMTSGNSGGPVTNTRGEVIGVSVAIIRDSPINFAIPSDKTSLFVQKQITSGGSFEYGRFAPLMTPQPKR